MLQRKYVRHVHLSGREAQEILNTLEALAVNDGRSALVVLLLGDPHLLEG
jgi:hypothetical protein